MMKSTTRMVLLLWALAGARMPALAAAAPAQPRLNVLLIVADDLRDAVGCYGNKEVKTPNLDRLAARGVRFDRAYAQYPTCNPSRCSFLTGMRPEQTGIVRNATMLRTALPDVVTLPQMLRQHGWYAASYGKVYHVEELTDHLAERMDVGKSWDEAKMFSPTPAGRVVEGRNLTGGKLRWCRWGILAGDDDDQPDGQAVIQGVATIEKLTAEGRPWIVATGFQRPHDPFVAPRKYFDLYPPGSLHIHQDPANPTPLPPLALSPRALVEAFAAFNDRDRLEYLRAYYAAVSFVDAQVGRLLDSIDRLNLWDRTVVIFISDHGYQLNERGWWNKGTLLEPATRVPLLIAAPGAKPGQASAALAELVDLYPTIADYCGIAPAGVRAGKSLRPVIENPGASAPERDAAFTLVLRDAGNFGQAVRTSRWRYIQWSDGAAELYDMVADPDEAKNLAGLPAQAAVVRELKARLQATVPFDRGMSERLGRAATQAERAEDESIRQAREHLERWLARNPDADFNHDGVLTASEAWRYQGETGQRARAAAEKKTREAEQARRAGRPVAPEPARLKPNFENVRYGPHERNVLDLWQAKSAKPTPLVIFYHGGAWKFGDKRDISDATIKACLQAGLSVAAVNYRFTTTAPLPAPQLDSARALQFLRGKAAVWNLDPKRVAAYGASAGAGISLWLAFHDDLADPASSDPVARQSTRLACAGSISGQCTYDPNVIRRWVGETAYQHTVFLAAYGVKTHAELGDPKLQKIYDEVSAIKHLTLDDPPVFQIYTEPDVPLPPDAKPGQGMHHPIFGHRLKTAMNALGIECDYLHVTDIPGDPEIEMVKFFQRQLGPP